MIGQMASAIALPGFNWILPGFWKFIDPYFSFENSFFLPIFYGWRNGEENLSVPSLNFSSCKMHDRIPLLVYLRGGFKCLFKGYVL